MRNASIPYSELETELYKKWVVIPPKQKAERQKDKEKALAKVRNSMNKDEFHKVHYKGAYLKRRALIDDQAEVDKNQRAQASYAERKWNWVGEEGVCPSADL